jgi:adenylyltransferase/sulfurtransferase
VPSCAEGGVLGVLPGLVGVIQATEVLKFILGKGEPLAGRLLLIDALNMRFRELKLRKNPDCPVCGTHPTVTALIDYNQFCGVSGAQESVTEAATKMTTLPAQNGIPQITPTELKRRRDAGDRFTLLDVREPWENQIASLGGQLIPLGELPKRLSELDREADIVVHCKAGGRSQQAAELLRQQGFAHVENLAGGITAWTNEIDPTLKKY